MEQLFPAVKAIIKKESKFLIVRQRVGNEDFWDLPGGKVEYRESPYEALKREVREEVGLAVVTMSPVGMWWFFRKKDGGQVVCTTFLCEVLGGEVDLSKNPSAEGIAEFRWVAKEEFLGIGYPVSHLSLKELVSQVL